MKELDRWIRIGNPRLFSFLGATSKQLLHYLDVNLDPITDTVKLHIKINDTSVSIIESFVTSIKEMAQICHTIGVTWVFI